MGLVFSEMESVREACEHHRAAAQCLDLEMLFRGCNAQRLKDFNIFHRNKVVLGDDLIRTVDGQLITIDFVLEKDAEVAIVYVPHLQQFVLNAPVDVTVGHVSNCLCRQVVHLAELPIAVESAVVQHVQFA